MNNFTLINHLKSLLLSAFSIIRSPESVPGNLLETFSEWKRSRRWLFLWITFPVLLINLGFLVTAGFSAFKSSSNIVQATMTQVSKRISLEDLSQLAFEEHYIRNRVKEREVTEIGDAEANRENGLVVRPKLVADEEFVNSEKFRESQVLLDRAVQASPGSVQAKFQLALLSSLDTKLPNPQKTANELMESLAQNEADIFPPAHAWMAVSLVGSDSPLKPTELIQLDNYLKVASKWKSIEPGLLTIYSQLSLQHFGKPEKALLIAKQAADSRPELNLFYAQLCKALGSEHESEFNRAIKEAEKAYSAKVGKPNQTDADRLGLAKILLMQEQRDKAVEVLEQGINDDPKAHRPIRNGLADLYIDRFRRDNENLTSANNASQSLENGELSDNELGKSNEEAESEAAKDVIWTNLQAAAKFDRDNPMVGQEIAVQWRKLATPPADLMEVLRYQLRENLATTGARLMTAELYLIKGQTEEAKKQWITVLEKDPNVIPALNNLAVILSREQTPKLREAIELIDRAYRMDPLNAEMCDTYGEIYMNGGRPMDAIAKLEEAIRIDPNRISTRKRLAHCYQAIGMTDMATEQQALINSLEEQRAKGTKAATKKE